MNHKQLAFCILAAFLLVAFSGAVYLHFHPAAAGKVIAWALVTVGTMAAGLNTVTYETPVSGVTAPTATQSFTHQEVSAVITGDGATLTFSVVHNWALSAADLAAGWPRVNYEFLLAAGYTAAALITAKNTNDVAFSNTAFTGAGLRVRVARPWTPTR